MREMMKTNLDNAKILTITPGVLAILLILLAVGGVGGVLMGALVLLAPIPAAITSIIGVISAKKAKGEGFTEATRYLVIGFIDAVFWIGVAVLVIVALVAVIFFGISV